MGLEGDSQKFILNKSVNVQNISRKAYTSVVPRLGGDAYFGVMFLGGRD